MALTVGFMIILTELASITTTVWIVRMNTSRMIIFTNNDVSFASHQKLTLCEMGKA